MQKYLNIYLKICAALHIILPGLCSYKYTKQLVLIILVDKMWRKQNFSCNKNKKPLTVHKKEKQIDQKVFKLIYIEWLFVVYLLVVAIENKERA